MKACPTVKAMTKNVIEARPARKSMKKSVIKARLTLKTMKKAVVKAKLAMTATKIAIDADVTPTAIKLTAAMVAPMWFNVTEFPGICEFLNRKQAGMLLCCCKGTLAWSGSMTTWAWLWERLNLKNFVKTHNVISWLCIVDDSPAGIATEVVKWSLTPFSADLSYSLSTLYAIGALDRGLGAWQVWWSRETRKPVAARERNTTSEALAAAAWLKDRLWRRVLVADFRREVRYVIPEDEFFEACQKLPRVSGRDLGILERRGRHMVLDVVNKHQLQLFLGLGECRATMYCKLVTESAVQQIVARVQMDAEVDAVVGSWRKAIAADMEIGGEIVLVWNVSSGDAVSHSDADNDLELHGPRHHFVNGEEEAGWLKIVDRHGVHPRHMAVLIGLTAPARHSYCGMSADTWGIPDVLTAADQRMSLSSRLSPAMF